MIEYLIIPLDFIILAIGSIVLITSFWRGFIASILGLLTWVGSIIITIYFYTDLSNFINSQLLNIKVFENYDQITIMLSTIISVPLIFLISLFILKKIRRVISSDIDRQIFGILFDKLFGFIFGFIFNYIIFSTIIYCTNNFEFLNTVNNWILDNSYLLKTLEDFNINILNYIIGGEEDIIN